MRRTEGTHGGSAERLHEEQNDVRRLLVSFGYVEVGRAREAAGVLEERILRVDVAKAFALRGEILGDDVSVATCGWFIPPALPVVDASEQVTKMMLLVA